MWPAFDACLGREIHINLHAFAAIFDENRTQPGHGRRPAPARSDSRGASRPISAKRRAEPGAALRHVRAGSRGWTPSSPLRRALDRRTFLGHGFAVHKGVVHLGMSADERNPPQQVAWVRRSVLRLFGECPRPRWRQAAISVFCRQERDGHRSDARPARGVMPEALGVAGRIVDVADQLALAVALNAV